MAHRRNPQRMRYRGGPQTDPSDQDPVLRQAEPFTGTSDPPSVYTIVKTLRLSVAESVARLRHRTFAYCPSLSKTQVSPTLRTGLLACLCARYRELGSRLRVQVQMSDKEPTQE